jgi:hypothetical protein
MQQRQQAEAAALESEVSLGPGLQAPGGVLGEDLWMFDGGLFAEEGRCRDARCRPRGIGMWLLSVSRERTRTAEKNLFNLMTRTAG